MTFVASLVEAVIEAVILQLASIMRNIVNGLAVEVLKISPSSILDHFSVFDSETADQIIITFSCLIAIFVFVCNLLSSVAKESVESDRKSSILKKLLLFVLGFVAIFKGKDFLTVAINEFYSYQNGIFTIAESIGKIEDSMRSFSSRMEFPIVGSICSLIYIYNILKVIIAVAIRHMELTLLILLSPLFFAFVCNEETNDIVEKYLKTVASYLIISFVTMWCIEFINRSFNTAETFSLLSYIYYVSISFVLVKIDVIFDNLGLKNNTASKSISAVLHSTGNMITNMAGRTKIVKGLKMDGAVKNGSSGSFSSPLLNESAVKGFKLNRDFTVRSSELEKNYRESNIIRNALGTNISSIGTDGKLQFNPTKKISLSSAIYNQIRGKGIDGNKNTDLLGKKSFYNGTLLGAYSQGKKDLAIRNQAIDRYKNSVNTVNSLKTGESISSEIFSTALNLDNTVSRFRCTEGGKVEKLSEGLFFTEGKVKDSNSNIKQNMYQISFGDPIIADYNGMTFDFNEYIELSEGVKAYMGRKKDK